MANEQIQGVPPGLTAEPIQGVPPGLTAEPIQQAAPEIEGVPPGLTAEPIQPTPRYHAPKSLSEEISDKGLFSGVGSWLRDDGSTVLKREDGQQLQSSDGGTTWQPYTPQEGDYQIRKGGPIVNLISAGQKPGTITKYNPIVPLPGEDFKDTMKRAVEAGKKITPEQLKEEHDENIKEAPGTLASAVALGATGPVVYGGTKGVSILKQAIVGGDSQILGHPENMMTPEFKKAHPYWAAAAEELGGLSTPETASMLIGAGKLGKLPGPASKIASRLVSGGFGLTMLSAAVKNSSELWDVMQGNGKYADMSDDDREWLAKNLAFHITTGVAMAAQSGEEAATGKSTPLTEFGEKADAHVAHAAQKIADLSQRAGSATVSSIGSMLGRTNDFDTAVLRASKVTPKNRAAHIEDIATAREDLQAILNDNKNVESPKEFGNAINEHIKNNENMMQEAAEATKNEDSPVVPNITQRLIDRLDKFFDDNKGLYGDESDVAEAKKKILEGILQTRNGQHLLEPNLFEAENVRRRFNRQGQPQYNTNAIPTTDAFKAGSLEAASELRKAIDESYDARGVKNVKEYRAKEASLINVRDALYGAQAKAESMGEGGVLSSLMKKIGVPSSVIAIALGHPISGAAVGAAILGDQIHQNLTNPNVNLSRAADLAGRVPGASSVVPTRTNSPLHVALASHFGEIIGQSTYKELEGRFMADIAAKAQRNVPLESNESKILNTLNDQNSKDAVAQQKFRDDQKKDLPKTKNATIPEDYENVLQPEGTTKMHPNMGVQEGLVHELAHIAELNRRGITTADGIRSHMHPENQESGAAMSVPIDWSDFKNEDGSMNRDKVRAKIGDIAAGYLAGGVANDLWHGIPISENKGMGADLNILKNQVLKEIGGYSEAEATKIINQSIDDLRETLSQPNIREILEQHAQVREPGLDNQHHFSQERIDQVLKDLEDATNANARPGNAPATSGEVRGGSKEVESGGKADREKGSKTAVRQESERSVEAEHPTTTTAAGVSGPAEPTAEPERKPGITPEPPKLGAAEPESEEPLMNELQTPHKNKYPIQIIDREGNSRIEQIEAYSPQGAFKDAQKKFPNESAWNMESTKPSEPGVGPTKYEIPTKKRLGVGTKSVIERNPNRTEDHVETHELGHAITGLKEGQTTGGMLRHTYPELGPNSRAAIMWKMDGLIDPQTRRIIPEKMPGFLRSQMGGIAADEAFNNYPRTQNHNFNIYTAGSDGNTAYRLLRREMPDASHEDIMGIMNRAIDQNIQYLTHPAVSDIIKENLGKREAGLSTQFHYSPDRLQQMHLEAQRRIQNAGPDYRTVGGEGGPGRGGAIPAGETAGAAGAPEGVREPEARAEVGLAPGEPESPKLSVPPERTTGNPEHDKIIREGGGVPGGMLGRADDEGHVKMFHDPQSGTTLGLRGTEPVTQDAVREKLAESRAAYAAPQVYAHDQNGGSTFSSEGKNLAGKDLYAVGSYPERTVQVDKLTPEVLAKFKSDNHDVLSQPGHAVGTWKDPDTGKSVLDISRTHQSRDEAIAAGRAANQKAIYHLGGEGEIQTGGTGEPESPKLAAPTGSKLDEWLEKESGYHPDLQAVIKTTRSLHDNPAALKEGGAFITPDGRISSMLPGQQHPETIVRSLGGTSMPSTDIRPDFLDRTGAVRTRFTQGREGDIFSVSVPKTGVTPEQVDMIRQGVGQVGRNGNFRIERSDVSPETRNELAKTKEFASPRDVEPMLREIGAHPEQAALKNPDDMNRAELKTELGITGDDPRNGLPNKVLAKQLKAQRAAPESPKLGPKGSSVPLMKKPLKIEGTSESGKPNTLDVAKALNEYTKSKVGALELNEADDKQMTDRAKKLAEDEAKYQLNTANSGKAWYTTDIGIHDDVLKRLRPELTDPAKLSLFKMSEAILSSGQNPYRNLKAAIRAWDHYNETGEFSQTNPATGKSWGPRGAAQYGNAMEMLNRLIKEKGEQGASDWLLSEHPVSELRQYNKLGVSGKNTDNALGAMILGEKRGPFAQNLHGIESAFTADMWVSRTWNRWMGTIEHDPKTGEITTEAPRNKTERDLMRQSFEHTAKALSEQRGENISTSALQAILWYYEQSLYSAHGVPKESWSFADTAKRIEREHAAAEPEAEKFGFGANEPGTEPGAEPEPENPPGQIHGLNFLKALGGK